MSQIEKNIDATKPGTVIKRPSWWLIAFLLLFPLVQTFLYFVIMAGRTPPIFQQGVYAITKIVMFVFPVYYTFFILKEKCRPNKFNKRGLLEGSIFGIGVLIGICLLYFLWFKPSGFIDPDGEAAKQIKERVANFRITTPLLFVSFGIFVSFIHSALEEYYWRWFTFGQLRKKISPITAAIIAGFGFMLHHVVILSVYFDVRKVETWLFSLAVAIGGMYWAWLYHRKQSIYAPWLSHAWIDMAIFIVGYDLVFGQGL